MSDYYTVIRVKRKLNDGDDDDDEDSNLLRHDVKRLRHIGSFSVKHDETSLNSQNILSKMGFKDRKRIRFSDLNTEQFSEAYSPKLKQTESKKMKIDPQTTTTSKEVPSNSGSKPTLNLSAAERLKQDYQKDQQQQQITCNGKVLLPVVKDPKENYLYDHYILLDDIVDYVDERKDENPYDDEEPSSNDENYPYNDYPDEGEVSPPTSDCDEEKDDEDNENHDEDEEYEDYQDPSREFCENFDEILLESDRNSNDGDDDDEDYDNEEYQQRIMNLKPKDL